MANSAFNMSMALCIAVLSLCAAQAFATESRGGLIEELRAETSYKLKAARKAGNVVELTQSSFEKGTVRLQKPGVYRLKEDITFNPNRGEEKDWLPVCDKSSEEFQPLYCDAERGGPSKPYRLGFFAAITIESKDVVLDLNGKLLEQSEEHSLQQRFFALVELAEQPFISPAEGKEQGPAPGGFGKVGPIEAARDSAVINGIMGNSAHHGIHGNNVSRVLIDGIKFREYEVASVHVNGARSLAVVDCVAEGQKDDVAVRGTYSGGRFILQALRPFLEMQKSGRDGMSEEAFEDISDKFKKLKDGMRQVREEVLATGKINDADLARQFGLSITSDGTGVVDGNSYGMAFSPTGVIVEAWKTSLGNSSTFGALSNLVLRNINISNTAANVDEVPTLSIAGGAGIKGSDSQTDSAGSAVRIEEILEDDGETYKPDLLHDLRFSVAWWASAKHGNDSFLVKAVKDKRLGTWKIDGALAAWARQGGKISDVIRDNKFVWMCNQDTMVHRQKGVVGLLIQGANGASVSRVNVKNTVNYGEPGTSERCGRYLYEAPNLEPARIKGYTGSGTRGVLAVASHKVSFKKVYVNGTRSLFGASAGLQMFNDMREVSLEHVMISGTVAQNLDNSTLPNSPRFARGLAIDDTYDLETRKLTVMK